MQKYARHTSTTCTEQDGQSDLRCVSNGLREFEI